MNIKLTTISTLPAADVLVMGYFEGQKPDDHPLWHKLPASARKVLKKWLGTKDLHPSWMKTEVMHLAGGKFPMVLMFGFGKKSDWKLRRDRLAARKIVRLAHEYRWRSFTLAVPNLNPQQAQLLAENFELADYDYHAYQSAPPGGWPAVRNVTLVVKAVTPELRRGLQTGRTIAAAANRCRTMANTPGSHMTPETLAAEAKKLGGRGLTVTILRKSHMEKLKMGAVLGVARGSSQEPRFIVMEYSGGMKSERPLVLCGKGVTFDSGGLNLKPEQAMGEMHMDMSGGAAVIAAMRAIADLRLKLNVVGLIPAVENMPSGSGYRPGDLLHSMSGKVIEVGNTDAEGRVILADALTYAKKFYKPQLMVDVATLTGAAIVALGQHATALMTKSETLEAQGEDIGEASGDYVWPLPMWDEYEADVKGTFGDVSNMGRSRWGGAISGAMFLYQFAKGTPWIHLDIAPTMTSVEGQHLAKGASGAGVRWLVEAARRVADGSLKIE